MEKIGCFITGLVLGLTISPSEYYEGTSLSKEDLPVKIKIKLISYVKTLGVLGYATWSL